MLFKSKPTVFYNFIEGYGYNHKVGIANKIHSTVLFLAI